MSKHIQNTHITGEQGVIEFAKYCNQHIPYIIFREITKSDFGIDGEVELTRINEERKIEPTAEIIKVQIKTNGTSNSYIQNEKSTTFEFYPRADDIQYWEQHKTNGLEVVLVIFDKRTGMLYCKKVIDADVFIGKETLKPGKKKHINAITFDKTENLLEAGKNDFTQKFSTSFKNRVTFGITETLLSNFAKYQAPPRQLYAYQAILKNKKEIFQVVTREEAPYFTIYKGIVYSFISLGASYSSFKEKVLTNEEPSVITFSQVLEQLALRNHYVELLNEYVKAFLWSKKMAYQRDFGRFYFRLPKDEQSLIVETTTRKRGQPSRKEVVKKFSYPKYSFYRHIALELKHFFVGDAVYLSFQPKYYFSQDGRKALEGELITKLTNFLTSREYNNHYCDWLHFWWSYLSKGNRNIEIYEDPAYKAIESLQQKKFYTTHLRITLSFYSEFTVDFGIAADVKEQKRREQDEEPNPQRSLFDI